MPAHLTLLVSCQALKEGQLPLYCKLHTSYTAPGTCLQWERRGSISSTFSSHFTHIAWHLLFVEEGAGRVTVPTVELQAMPEELVWLGGKVGLELLSGPTLRLCMTHVGLTLGHAAAIHDACGFVATLASVWLCMCHIFG